MSGRVDPVEERRNNITAFNSTTIKIWREQISLLSVVRTGALYRSTIAVGITADAKITSVTLEQSFRTYGLSVDYGTGSNTPRGNPGDLGDLGKDMADTISNALTRDISRHLASLSKLVKIPQILCCGRNNS